MMMPETDTETALTKPAAYKIAVEQRERTGAAALVVHPAKTRSADDILAELAIAGGKLAAWRQALNHYSGDSPDMCHDEIRKAFDAVKRLKAELAAVPMRASGRDPRLDEV